MNSDLWLYFFLWLWKTNRKPFLEDVDKMKEGTHANHFVPKQTMRTIDICLWDVIRPKKLSEAAGLWENLHVSIQK
jgi:hypothetical protein